MAGESVGNYMQSAKAAATKTLITLAGVLVYVAGVIYAEIHGYSLLSRGVDPDMLIWATMGIIAVGITALALPMGLHYSFHDTMQRIAAFAFYALDLGIMILNAVLDFQTRTGAVPPGWLLGYLEFVVPATPILAALGGSGLALLDPGQKEMAMLENLKASTRQALALRVAEAAKNANINDQVDQAARLVAYEVITGTLGSTTAGVTRQQLPETIDSRAQDVPPKAAHPTSGRNTPVQRRRYIAYWPRWEKGQYQASVPSQPLGDKPVNPTQPDSGQKE